MTNDPCSDPEVPDRYKAALDCPGYTGEVEDAKALVNERFSDIKLMMDEYKPEWNQAMTLLKSVFSNVTANDISQTISYDFVDDTDPVLDLEQLPPAPGTDITRPTEPHKFDDLQKIVFQEVSEFNESLNEINEPSIEFQEAVYQLGLLDDLKDAMATLIKSGGTGLGEDIEEDIWTRARARQDFAYEQANTQAMTEFAARGFTLPPGALAAKLRQIATERSRNDTQLNAEIAIEQARLAQADTQNVRAIAVQIAQLDREAFNRAQQRAFEKARDSAATILQAYEVKKNRFVAIAEASKINVEAESMRADAISRYNESIVNTFKADVDAYSSQVQLELSIIETNGKIYASKIAGWDAKATALSKELDAKVEMLKARVQQSNNQTALSLQEAELVLSKYLKGLELDEDMQKANAQLMTQIMASLFTAVSVTASMGDSQSFSQSQSLNGDNFPTVSKSYNYSISE